LRLFAGVAFFSCRADIAGLRGGLLRSGNEKAGERFLAGSCPHPQPAALTCAVAVTGAGKEVPMMRLLRPIVHQRNGHG
jgi:hypothetical protein